MPGADLDACLTAVKATGHPDAAALARAAGPESALDEGKAIGARLSELADR
jgi:hypothetical protein